MAGPGSTSVEIKLRWVGRVRTIAFGRWLALLLLVCVPLLAIGALGGSLYLVFHDDLLAALIQRQTELQYAYEDRIAALKSEIDAGVGGSGEDRISSEALRLLGARGARLEERAAALETLAATLRHDGPTDRATPILSPQGQQSGALEPGIDGRRPATVVRALNHAEAAESAATRDLRQAMLGRIARITSALTETGLPPQRWQGSEGLGGPFVPLPEIADADSALALLRSAAQEQVRLSRLVERIPLRRPLQGPLEVTSPFGPRVDPFLGRAALHTGIDLHETEGDAVSATAAGTVTIAGADGGYGNLVEIDHGDGLATRYGHLSAVEVRVGQHVAAGDVVGRVGATGRATGPHLHYETRIGGAPVDPARFLRAAAIIDPE